MVTRTITESELPEALAGEFKKIDDYLKSMAFTVGVHQEQNSLYANGRSLAYVSVVNTFGYEPHNIPARPFLNPGIQEGQLEIVGRMIKGIRAKQDSEEIVEAGGEAAVEAVREYMVALKIPANQPSTIAKKGADNPLIDTGQLKAAIGYRRVES